VLSLHTPGKDRQVRRFVALLNAVLPVGMRSLPFLVQLLDGDSQPIYVEVGKNHNLG
jgi:hypothetical protein